MVGSLEFILNTVVIHEGLLSGKGVTRPGLSLRAIALAAQLSSVAQSCQTLCNSVAQSCQTLCNSIDCSTPGFPVYHQLPEFTQTHVHQVSDAIQPSYPLSSPSPPVFNLPSIRIFSNEFFTSGGQRIRVSALASSLLKKSQG